jgi:hypothetical protein
LHASLNPSEEVPFTFSHPAVVLPLSFVDKKRLSITALTIGSLTPDFEYFLTLEPVSFHAHSLLGILWFDLPLSILLFYVYTNYVKDELIDNLPSFLSSRFTRFKNVRFSRGKYLVILTSLLVGITSHILWDKVTHRSALFLVDVVESYSFVWNASSVLGGLVIAAFVWRLPKTRLPIKRDNFLFWFVTLSTILVVTIIRVISQESLQYLVIAAVSGLFLGLLLASTMGKLMRNKKDPVNLRKINIASLADGSKSEKVI